MTEGVAEIADARERAGKLYRARSFQRVYVEGVRARLAGRPIHLCPYKDTSATWGRSYRKAWRRGWQSLEEASAEA